MRDGKVVQIWLLHGRFPLQLPRFERARLPHPFLHPQHQKKKERKYFKKKKKRKERPSLRASIRAMVTCPSAPKTRICSSRPWSDARVCTPGALFVPQHASPPPTIRGCPDLTRLTGHTRYPISAQLPRKAQFSTRCLTLLQPPICLRLSVL